MAVFGTSMSAHHILGLETGSEPVRNPVPRSLSIFNILKMEMHKAVAYAEDRILPIQVIEVIFFI